MEQNYADLEIILIEDHSEDNSFEILKELFFLYKDHIIIDKSENKGVSAARNKGLSVATGEIITFCDADDTTSHHSLQYLESFFLKHEDIDMLIGGFNRIIEEDKIKKISIGFGKETVWSADKTLRHALYDFRVMGSVCNKFFRKRIIHNFRFDESLSHTEDTHFVVNLLSCHRNAKVFVCSEPLYNYYLNMSSATNSADKLFDKKDRLNYDIAMERILKFPALKAVEKITVRHGRFTLAADVLLQIDITSAQRRELLNIMRNNWSYYAVVLPWNLKGDVKRLLMLCRKLFLEKRQ